MNSSHINIQIGCDGSEHQQKYQQIQLKLTLQQSKINEYNNHIQKQLVIKKTPMLVIQLGKGQKNDIKQPILVSIFQKQFELRQKINGDKTILYGDLKDQDKLVLARKIQRLFHLMTQSKAQLNLQIKIYNSKQKNTNERIVLSDFFEHAKIKGTFKHEQKLSEIFKKCIIKVSPKFLQSPIYVLFQLFKSLDFNLNLQSLNVLEQNQRNHVFCSIFNLEQHNKNISQIARKSQDQTKIIFCLQKLLFVQLSGPSQLMSVLLQYL